MSLQHAGSFIPYQGTGAPSTQDFPATTVTVEPKSVSDLRASDERGVIADALTVLGDHARRHGATVIAAFHYADALALTYELGDRLGMVHCLEGVAHLASARGKPIHAAWFLSSAATIRRAIGAPHRPPEEVERRTTISAVRAQVEEDAFAAAWVSGEAVPHEEAIAQALAFLLTPVVGASFDLTLPVEP